MVPFRKGPSAFSPIYFCIGAFVFPFLTGCAPESAASFSGREEVSELPERQQDQLRGYLRMFYGSPDRPRFMSPTGEEIPEPESTDEKPEVAESEDSSSEGKAESAKHTTTPKESSEVPGLVAIPRAQSLDAQHLQLGHDVYRRQCVHCHGVTGDGVGPAAQYLQPKPRDYRSGIFKFTSTSRGSKPLRGDLMRIIRNGAKGTSMPSFRWMPEDELQAVIDYVMLLSERGELERNLLYLAENDLSEDEDFDPETVMETVTDIQDSWKAARNKLVLPQTPMTAYSDEAALAGRKAFLTRGCAKCHGTDGRGNTQGNVGKDDWGNVVFAADLTSGMLHGGRRPIDIYRRIWAGVNGTPMPAFDQALAETPETAWDLVHYIQSLAMGKQIRLSPEEEEELSKPKPEEAVDTQAANLGLVRSLSNYDD